MFKFTIRELLLLTVIVGIGVGWWLRERQLGAQVGEWHARTGILEHILKGRGTTITWTSEPPLVWLHFDDGGSSYDLDYSRYRL